MLTHLFSALLLLTSQLLGGAHMEHVKFGESLWEHPVATGCPNLLSIQKKACPCPQGTSSQAGR